ncbi:hypothetical protein [Hymenobacter sp. BT730]|uniref:hypothetical protein n=1 Tax=Hymenobacter sp. BT730 TaxID=3063332 RepID=UPI0026E04A29|nr:hypothetical protein [Hymenobacter sp. BT730]
MLAGIIASEVQAPDFAGTQTAIVRGQLLTDKESCYDLDHPLVGSQYAYGLEGKQADKKEAMIFIIVCQLVILLIAK